MKRELKCVISLGVCFMVLFASRSTLENMEVRKKLSFNNTLQLYNSRNI